MRRLIILVLCLLLPLQGFAVWQAPASPCPMQDMMAMVEEVGETADALAEAMEDCCNDMATFELTGQPCKSVQSCAAPAAGLLSIPSLVAQTPATLDPQAPAWRSLPPGATTRLWRPPTSV
ncbi:hypothetical protein BSY239_1851 [Hydrogenophaga sp. RAC07]|uniref:hypothetical protein n=1 Tax=Hydrogenophaga sp. RAC07 TaxID=1842537 RepID=UPI00083E0EA4|nr:hypothetical protein [Hydrogenophaga sp. RAC07]AOF85930.1 hypothetical protein BSY239_1851 [Hydrogenophaga sp. RAC07]